MDPRWYQAVLKRRSFHLFRNVGAEALSAPELEEIRAAWESFEPLCPDVRTAIRIVPAKSVNFKHDAEYCVLIYSEKKDNYLMNAGYLGEQLDLYLVSRRIGTLWFGIGKPDEAVYDGLDYVIMIALRKLADESLFRGDLSKVSRKPLEEIWAGDTLGLAEIARYAPSAVNSQPWFVRQEGRALTVFRRRRSGKLSFLSASAAAFFNRIDLGIFLCTLELCMAEKRLAFTRELFVDDGGAQDELTRVAVYTL